MSLNEKKPLIIVTSGENTNNVLPVTASFVGYDTVTQNYVFYDASVDAWRQASSASNAAQFWQSEAPGNIFTTGSVVISGNLNQAQYGLLNTTFYSHVEGYQTTASANFAHAEGSNTTASGTNSHAEGYGTLALGVGSHAEGNFTTASNNAHSEGTYTLASGDGSHAEGYFAFASGTNSHAEGNLTEAHGNASHSEGSFTITFGYAAHAEGWLTTGSGDYSHAEGHLSVASGNFAHAEGSETQALGEGSHAEGGATTAAELGTHAEGLYTIASGYAAHAEGIFTVAVGVLAHAEGGYTLATGNGAHTEGYLTTGSGLAVHAQGYLTDASGSFSFAGGIGTIASGSGQSVLGQYNQRNNDFSLFVIGDGTTDSDVDRHDILRVNTGRVEVTGSFVASAGITGSLTELTDGTPYLLAGTNIQLSTGSNGAVTISSTGGGNNYWQSDVAGNIFTTGSAYVSASLTAEHYLQLKPTDVSIPTNVTASYVYTSGSTNDLYFTQYSGPYTNTVRLRWLEGTLNTGLLHGGVLSTTNGSTSFNITSGSGIVVSYNASTTTDPYPTVQFLQWPAYTNQSLTYVTSSQITYIGINNSGGIIQRTIPFNEIDYENYIVIGRVLHQSGSVTNGTITSPATAYANVGSHDTFVRAFGPLKLSGHVLAASGSTLGLTKTGGDSYVLGRNYTANPSSPDLVLSTTDFALTGSKIFREYVSGSTPIIDSGVGNAGYTVIDPTQYNNNGTLTPLTSGQFTVQRVYWFPNSVNRALFVYYGTQTYGSIDAAESSIQIEDFVEGANTAGAAILVGYIIVKGNASDLTNSNQAKIIQAPLFRSAGTGGGGGAGGATTPGGLDTYVQFNDGGSTFGGVAGLTFNKSTNTLSTTNLVVSSIATVSGNVTLGDAASDVVTSTGQLTASNGLSVVGSTQVSNGVNIAAGGLQVAGVVPGISAPYNNTPVIIDLASGQVYGPVIRSAAGSFNFAGHSLDQGGTYLGGVYGLANNPGSAGFIDGINFATVGSRNLGFNINNTLIGKFSTSGLQVTGSANVSNGVYVAAGGLQVAGTVPGISAPYNNSPMIVDLASGQSYGPVIRSAIGQFNYAALSFDQNGTYLGGIYNIANDPGNGYIDGMNITTAGGRKIGFFVNGTTAVAKITSDGLQVTGSINISSTITAATGFSGSLTKLTDGSSYLVAGNGISISSASNGPVTISTTGLGRDVYAGYTTGSHTWSSTTWADFSSVATSFTSSLTPGGITLSGSTFTVTNAGTYAWNSMFNAVANDSYLGWRLSGSNGTLLQHTHFSTKFNMGTLTGLINLSAGESFKLQYVFKSGGGIADIWTSTTIDGEETRTGNISIHRIT